MPGAPLKPMLAVTGELPGGSGWGFEFKWDGIRAIADIRAGRVRLYARTGVEITVAYPELAPLGAQVPDALLDGEVVVLAGDGRPSFVALAERMHVRRPARAAQLAATVPVTYMIFDVLRLPSVPAGGVDPSGVPAGGPDLSGWSYQSRRAALETLGLAGTHWAVPPAFPDGPATYHAAGEHGLEGVLAKRLDSTYRPGARSPDWVKVKLEVTADFVVGGWRPGARRIGALLIGVPGPGGGLIYRGRVGGGIGVAVERELLAELTPLRTEVSPFTDPVTRADAQGAIWVRPQLVIEVKYGQRTPDGRLRFPRLRRLRPDKTIEEVNDAS